jgi:UDP-2,3-diacylglucosamine pyrophosphatase LpxH
MLPSDPTPVVPDIIVVSDLHMGRGKNPATRRFYNLETFFWDEDFAHFCDYLCRDAASRTTPFKLVFNGDTFDLLRIEPDPQDTHAGLTESERRFGPAHTPAQAAKTVAQVLGGHKKFVAAVAQVLNAGYEVIFLPGNHDIEVQWEPVQQAVRAALMQGVKERYGEHAEPMAQPLLTFAEWFYHEPGRVWIEHGCQYDPENSFRYLLRRNLADMPDALHETEQDLPLGNFFQRYLYNFFGHITFIVPTSRANMRYIKWLLVHEPSLLAKVAFSHGPFMFQVLRRLSRANKLARLTLRHAHDGALNTLSVDTGLGTRLLAIDALKEVRADVVQAVRLLSRQALKFVGGAFLFSLMAAGLWFVGFESINELTLGFGPKALLFCFFNVMMAGALGGAAIYATLGNGADVSPRPLRRAAQRIASILEIPLVAFGHTHDEELWRLDRSDGAQSWYCNTGTWIAVFTHDVLLPRERVQYTYLHIKGDNGELLHWTPGRGQPMPVILLDEAAVSTTYAGPQKT